MVTLNEWAADKEFQGLLDRVLQLKLEFFESAFMRKVEEGDPAAVMFAIKQVPGYRETAEQAELPEHEKAIDILALDLTVACKREILAAIKSHQEAQRQQNLIIDATAKTVN